MRRNWLDILGDAIGDAYRFLRREDAEFARYLMACFSFVAAVGWVIGRTHTNLPTLIATVLSYPVVYYSTRIAVLVVMLLPLSQGRISATSPLASNLESQMKPTFIRIVKLILLFELICAPFYLLDWLMGW